MGVSQLRIFLIVVSSGLFLVTGCRSKPPALLEPSVIEFPATYTRFTNSVDVKFTLGGKPVTGFEIALSDPNPTNVFSASSYSPLGASPFVTFAPVNAGEYTGELRVVHEGREYAVTVKGTARETPPCGVTEACLVGTFDPVQEKCVVNNQVEGTSCALFMCDGRSVCRSGKCVFEPTPDLIPLCVPTEPTETLQPAWTYTTHFKGGQIVFHGTTDRDGNMYFMDCFRQSDSSATCDAVSLTADGIERWRAPSVSSFPNDSLYYKPPQIVVVGDRLIIGRSNEARQIQVLKSDDGSVLWSREFSRIAGLTRLNDEQLAVLSGPGSLLSVISLQEGAIVSERSIADNAPWGVMSSGTGMLFALIGDAPDTTYRPQSMQVFGASPSGDASWPTNVNSPGLVRLMAASGALLVRSDGLVLRATDGKALFTVPAVFDLFDVVLPDDEHAIAVTNSTMTSCDDTRLKGFDLTKGKQRWECIPGARHSQISLSTLHVTADGGVAFVSSSDSHSASIGILHADGSLAFAAQFPSDLAPRLAYFGPSLVDDSMPTVVGGRWVMGAYSRTSPSPTSMIVAFAIPGLASGTKGWIARGGNLRRDGSPE